jgi:hypothetical protein
MSQQNTDLSSLKAAAKHQFGHIQGVTGFGVGEQSLRIYVRNSEVKKRLPEQFQGVPVDYIVTGDITAEVG